MESFSPDSSLDDLTETSIDFAKTLITIASVNRTRRDKANRQRFARMIANPSATKLTMMLTDRVIRIRKEKNAATALKTVSKYASVAGVGFLDFVSLKLATAVANVFPAVIMRPVRWRVRHAAEGIILPAEPEALSRHLVSRAKFGAKLNINVLGEAILGEAEAQQRCGSILEMMSRPEVDYVSVKISAIVSQINSIDHDGSVDRVASQLRNLYRKAISEHVFVNLDMEEFKDLRITVDVFMQLLDEPEFADLTAGIVLQAYLPDSHLELERLISWAKQRHVRTGSQIKIRIVKGANLAQEHVDSEIHGWNFAPYTSKSEVDASYLRMLDQLLRSENASAIRVGVASHNLFHLAWAIKVAETREVTEQIDIEMLEGMANGESAAVAQTFGGVLLYSPVAYREDFPSAVAYLVRRLDENTSPENYLSASFSMSTSGPEFEDQRIRFVQAVADRHLISIQSSRHEIQQSSHAQGFVNSADSDPTSLNVQASIRTQLSQIMAKEKFHVPLIIENWSDEGADFELGLDPNSAGEVWYTYSVANRPAIEQAINSSEVGFKSWHGRATTERGAILQAAAEEIQRRRFALIALMARDSGKPVMEADAEISEAVDFANYYSMQGEQLTGESAQLGIVLVVPPWNFPFAIPLGGVCAALAAGNSVILKPAPETVAVASQIVEILHLAGVPKNVLQFVPCRDDEVGKYLVSHSAISTVILTGAFDTALMFKSWRPEINLMAETSGKNSILISASADIDSAVKDLVNSAFGHAGQKCSAASIAIVDATIYDSEIFRSQLKDAANSLAFGPSTDIRTTNGPLIRPPTAALLRALTHLDEGEEWLLEPKQLDTGGFLWSAGIKMGVKPGSWSQQNEWFGPVLGVMRSSNFAEAIEWQNSTQFGLTAGIASLDEAECTAWVQQVAAGNLYVNRGITGAIVARQPFGGWKLSSVGPTAKAGGPHYLAQLCAWPKVTNVSQFIASGRLWLAEQLEKVTPTSDLLAELNYFRMLPHTAKVLAVIDSNTDKCEIKSLEWLANQPKLNIEILNLSIEGFSLEQIISKPNSVGKIRWRSIQPPPELDLLHQGITVDRRPIAQEASIELPRWLREQSISVTNHRYGNIGAAPAIKFLT